MSIWLSVDPMSSERSWLTPYNFVQNNPFNLVDPTGMIDGEPDGPGGTEPPRDWSTDGKNKLEEVVVTAPKRQGTSESDERDYGGTLEQWRSQHEQYYRDNPNAEAEYNQYWDMMAQAEKDQELLRKLQTFVFLYNTAGAMGLGALQFPTLNGPKSFNYNVRYNTGSTSNELSVQFGNNANQVSHAFRHTDAMGLSRAEVSSMVKSDLVKNISELMPGQPFNRVIQVSGRNIQYTAYRLSNGTINIGRIHGAP